MTGFRGLWGNWCPERHLSKYHQHLGKRNRLRKQVEEDGTHFIQKVEASQGAALCNLGAGREEGEVTPWTAVRSGVPPAGSTLECPTHFPGCHGCPETEGGLGRTHIGGGGSFSFTARCFPECGVGAPRDMPGELGGTWTNSLSRQLHIGYRV